MVPGLKLWLRADHGTYQDRTGASAATVAVADGDPVGTWRDCSPSQTQWINGSDAKRPTLKLAVRNGLPALRFDATDDEFTCTLNLSGSLTVFCALSTSGLGQNNYGYIFGAGSSTNGVLYQQDISSSGQVRMTAGGTSFLLTPSTLNAWESRTWVFNGATSFGQRKGAFDTAGTTGTLAWSNMTLGADGSTFRHFAGDLGELLFYEGAMNAVHRAGIEAYMNSRWGPY